MYLAVPLSWSLSLVRPVTLRPNLSVGLPFDSYWADLSGIALPACDSRDRGAQGWSVYEGSRPQFFISTEGANFSCLGSWSGPCCATGSVSEEGVINRT